MLTIFSVAISWPSSSFEYTYDPIIFIVVVFDKKSIVNLSPIIGSMSNSNSIVSPALICFKVTLLPSIVFMCVFNGSIFGDFSQIYFQKITLIDIIIFWRIKKLIICIV